MDQLLALRMFVRIADCGSFSKAADAMNIPRPTATKLIQDLEQHVGAKLLQRTTRRLHITPEGAAYHERATRLLDDLRQMDENAAGAQTRLRGRIRVDVGSVFASLVLIPALPGFQATHPELQIDLGVSDRPLDMVGEGVDCVVRGGKLGDTSLIARRIADLDWVTCASPQYLERCGTPRHPSDLLSADHAVVQYFSSLSGKADPMQFHQGDQHLTTHENPAIGVNESLAHLNALVAGLGVGQTFKSMAAPHLHNGSLRTVLDDWTRPPLTLHVLYPSRSHLSMKVRLFVDWLVQVFAPFDNRRVNPS